MRPITVVDLFAGIGGFSESLQDLFDEGTVVLCGIDIDEAARATWTANRPRVPYVLASLEPGGLPLVWNETARVGVERGSLDVLVASPPCQLMSSAGRRVAQDETNKLFISVLKAVQRWRPRAIAMENVPQFFGLYGGAYASYARSFLAAHGYRSELAILDAARYGVPQRRRRGFLIAVLKDMHRGGTLFPEPTHELRTSLDALDSPRTSDLPSTPSVEDAIGDLPPLKSGEGSQLAVLADPPHTLYQRERRNGLLHTSNHVAWSHTPEMVARMRTVSEGQAPQNAKRHPARPKSYFRQAYARLSRRTVAGTITTNFHNPGSGRFTHYRDDRTLTIREAARIQSFDDSYKFMGHMSQASRHVGNAVPPLLARAVVGALIRHIRD